MSEFKSSLEPSPREVVVGRLDKLIKEHFGQEQFHNPEHSADVDNLSYSICQRVKAIDPTLLTDQQELGREAAARGHDSVIEYWDSISGFDAGERVRRRGFYTNDRNEKSRAIMEGGNEADSALKIIDLIHEADPNGAIYKEIALAEIGEAVAATYPEFCFEKLPTEKLVEMDSRVEKYLDAEGKGLRVYQPHLKPESSIVPLSIALADLSSAGMLPVETTIENGNAEYREKKDKIGYLLNEGMSKIPDEEKQKIIDDMKKWLRAQVQFYAWRKIETEKTIKEHKFKTSEENQQKIQNMFRDSGMYERFNRVITASINRSLKYEDKPFTSLELGEQLAILAREFGYKF